MANTANAQIGSRFKLYYWNLAASPDAYAAIPNIVSLSELGAKKPETISTDLDSTGVERIGGLSDGDEFTITCVANAITHPLLKGFYDAGVNLTLKEVAPAPMSITQYFDFTPLGYALGGVTPSGLMTCALRGRISGDITSVDPHV